VNEYQQFINNEIVSLEQETEVAVKEEKTPNEEGGIGRRPHHASVK
jgi:ABC-2 type transport system permease protein